MILVLDASYTGITAFEKLFAFDSVLYIGTCKFSSSRPNVTALWVASEGLFGDRKVVSFFLLGLTAVSPTCPGFSRIPNDCETYEYLVSSCSFSIVGGNWWKERDL